MGFKVWSLGFGVLGLGFEVDEHRRLPCGPPALRPLQFVLAALEWHKTMTRKLQLSIGQLTWISKYIHKKVITVPRNPFEIPVPKAFRGAAAFATRRASYEDWLSQYDERAWPDEDSSGCPMVWLDGTAHRAHSPPPRASTTAKLVSRSFRFARSAARGCPMVWIDGTAHSMLSVDMISRGSVHLGDQRCQDSQEVLHVHPKLKTLNTKTLNPNPRA